jgi:hypothetical protein
MHVLHIHAHTRLNIVTNEHFVWRGRANRIWKRSNHQQDTTYLSRWWKSQQQKVKLSLNRNDRCWWLQLMAVQMRRTRCFRMSYQKIRKRISRVQYVAPMITTLDESNDYGASPIEVAICMTLARLICMCTKQDYQMVNLSRILYESVTLALKPSVNS